MAGTETSERIDRLEDALGQLKGRLDAIETKLDLALALAEKVSRGRTAA